MSSSILGILEKVDLRQIWKHEAINFTNWLAKPENIQVLSEELDIELDNIKTEEASGRYSVDIVADEMESGRKVIIENQLEITDHRHLGQILTYASAHDASIIIWITKDYTEEHKQAIDWFNRHMPEEISFFLIQIELWKIGDSQPAPKFNIISRPNNWAKTFKKASSSNDKVSEIKLTQQRFWTEFKEYSEKAGGTKVNLGRTPRPQHWYDISIGTTKGHLSLTINTRYDYIACELYIRSDHEFYQKLLNKKEAIESVIDRNLDWMDLEDKSAYRIQSRYQCNPFDEEKWETYFEWLRESVDKFYTTFKPYI